ncbi:MAG TPA: hypothetical protein VEP90_07385 [Methylomirabilota bacterium]|nr:hypothetical protein [Methylomirabilota bacterium]
METCFMMMPFRQEFEDIYREIILDVFNVNSTWNLKCFRGDDMFTTGSIMQDVWQSIRAARITIAELTGRNPNVFYELGIAHVLKKPVILITQKIEDVPFDIRHLRCIVYQLGPRGLRGLHNDLEKTINQILVSDTRELALFT